MNKNATQAEIKEAYKRLAKKYHPDVSKESEAEAKFKEVLEAYNCLSDEQKRSNYDQFGDAAEKFSGFGNFGGFEGFSHTGSDFGDIFSDMGIGGFGDLFRNAFGSRSRGPQRGSDIVLNLSVPFEDAVFGAEKEVEVKRKEICDECKGEGTTKNDGKKNCSTCDGRGIQQTVRRTFLGTIATSTPCRACGGEGTVITDPCKKCDGKKIVGVRKKIKLKIPQGVSSGNHLRLEGQGQAGESGADYGDLIIVIFVEPHKIFKRDRNDVYMELPISFSEAALGTTIEVPTLRKKAKLKVPSGTQTDTIFRLKEQGIKELGGNRVGDEYIKAIIKTPEKLSKEQRALFEEMAKIEGTQIRKTGFFEDLKKRFK